MSVSVTGPHGGDLLFSGLYLAQTVGTGRAVSLGMRHWEVRFTTPSGYEYVRVDADTRVQAVAAAAGMMAEDLEVHTVQVIEDEGYDERMREVYGG